ncbi:cytochrome-c oxidase, cbb3-type subunit II [Ferrimonas lipolytica]|uniref:Cytochrome-c oxidase, cbb3-type subunit II n=1 Tax=Ferrimonas lipolytica TaxID=2724191 RepID=A0A6H1UC21_9GAMM|nr:cytochrome-c oxidase, cbb3-type subunit II [Ferrimonas lipolytica]QIZ76584.1 cytochrome-c oxidase, cbb3-type subunit II [Ferrimonas lipolytica]
MKFNHEIIEKNVGWMAIMIVIAISFGGIAQIVPLIFQDQTTKPVEGLMPYTALQMEGRDIYIREGCVGCHSQMIRPFRAETERYGHYSVAGESVWEHPFLWGSKRTGPDLARVGGRYSDDWHRVHLIDPRAVVPESNMPGFPWLEENRVDSSDTVAKLKLFRDNFGVPYGSDEELEQDAATLADKTEMDALIAYLQVLGTGLK